MPKKTSALLLLSAAGLLMACPKKPLAEPTPVPTAAPITTPDSHASAMALADLGDFDQTMADSVVKRASRNAQTCAPALDKAPRSGDIDVVFDGPKGRIVDVKLGDAFSGISEQGVQCIRNAYTAEVVPPFSGGSKTVKYKLELPAAAPAASGSAKKP